MWRLSVKQQMKLKFMPYLVLFSCYGDKTLNFSTGQKKQSCFKKSSVFNVFQNVSHQKAFLFPEFMDL